MRAAHKDKLAEQVAEFCGLRCNTFAVRRPWQVMTRQGDCLREEPTEAFPAGKPLSFWTPRQAIDFVTSLRDRIKRKTERGRGCKAHVT